MAMYYHIINHCDVELWGIPAVRRLQKVLDKAGLSQSWDESTQLAEHENVLLIDVKYLFDANVLKKLVAHEAACLHDSVDKKPVAVWVKHGLAREITANIRNNISWDDLIASVPAFSPHDLTGNYDPRLRKFDLSYVVPVKAEHRRVLENYLYDKSYKGITDLVTKWMWPLPARVVVRQCARLKITPNMVTGFGWLLTLLAGIAFYYGQFALGLAFGWVMTFLDTVDGKLARVTMQSSKIGHAMDHGLDIIHPPAWYWCWAMGLQTQALVILGFDVSTVTLLWWMFAAYVGGRIFEGLFQLAFNDISIFCWKPIDSYHRLVTARRNPCMILFTAALIFADASLGFLLIVAWTVISTLLLGLRFFYALFVRITQGPLSSWIEFSSPEQEKPSLSTRLFTGYQATKTMRTLYGRNT